MAETDTLDPERLLAIQRALMPEGEEPGPPMEPLPYTYAEDPAQYYPSDTFETTSTSAAGPSEDRLAAIQREVAAMEPRPLMPTSDPYRDLNLGSAGPETPIAPRSLMPIETEPAPTSGSLAQPPEEGGVAAGAIQRALLAEQKELGTSPGGLADTFSDASAAPAAVPAPIPEAAVIPSVPAAPGAPKVSDLGPLGVYPKTSTGIAQPGPAPLDQATRDQLLRDQLRAAQTQAGPAAGPAAAAPGSALEQAIAGGYKPAVATPAASPAAGTPSAQAAPVQNQTGAASVGSQSLQGLTAGVTNQLESIRQQATAPGASPDVLAVYLKQAQSILGVLDQQESQLRADNAKQGTTLDPAAQFAIDKIRETLQQSLKGVREDLNRRGLYESGIELELENRLQKGSASDEARLLSDRFTKLQDQLNQGLGQIRQQRYQTLGQFGLAGANAAVQADESARKLGFEREQAALQGMLNLRGQMNTADIAARSQEAENSRQQQALSNALRLKTMEIAAARAAGDAERAAAAQRQANEIAAALQRTQIEQTGAAGRNAATISGENARNAASIAAANARSAAERAAADERARLAREGNFSKTNTDLATDHYLQFGDVGSALRAVQNDAETLQRRGVDIAALNRVIISRLPGGATGTPNRE